MVEFAASALLYERASGFSVREEEAHRLAEHLVIARRLVGEQAWRDRGGMAEYVSTDRYVIRWKQTLPPPPPLSAELHAMQQQITSWEPSLAKTDLRLHLNAPGKHDVVGGGLLLPDGTWLHFKMVGLSTGWGLRLNWIVLALVPAIALVAVGGLLVRLTLRPLEALAAAVQRIGRGDTTVLKESGAKEVRGLIRAFNKMQEQIRAMIADRTEALAAVGHDLRTPLARLQLRTEAIADPVVRRQAAADIDEMGTMIASVLAYLSGEDDPETPVSVDIAVIAATIIDDIADRGRDGRYIGPDHLEMIVRPNGFKRALSNLVENALHYGQTVTVSLEALAETVVLNVDDDGPGIPEDAIERALRPFTRLDAARSRNTGGLGLGLAIVSQMVKREGGALHLANRAEGGLRARITLPRPEIQQ
ncbi:ATP-binding protein [Sphingobium boeckii]|nr:ATP-binding protein [Sphingobium boeckii]